MTMILPCTVGIEPFLVCSVDLFKVTVSHISHFHRAHNALIVYVAECTGGCRGDHRVVVAHMKPK